MFEDIKQQVKVVVEARQEAEKAHIAKNQSYLKWQEDNATLLSDVAAAAEILSEAENKLRELALAAFNETGNKAPVSGVGIREVMLLEYNPEDAFRWAIEHNLALKLDTNAFEKIAKSSPPDFVAVSHVPKATISADLKVEEQSPEPKAAKKKA